MRKRLIAALTVSGLALTVVPTTGATLVPSLPTAPVNVAPPAIAGSAAAGSTVTCTPGQWLDGPTAYSYSWQRDLVTTIAGPSGSSQYTLTTADVGNLITCEVTA